MNPNYSNRLSFQPFSEKVIELIDSLSEIPFSFMKQSTASSELIRTLLGALFF